MKAVYTIGLLMSLSPAAMAAIKVDKIAFNGTACPAGTGVSPKLEDNQLVLKFVDFQATRGDGSPLSESRKNCVLTLSISSDDGSSFTISSVTGSGSADVLAGTQMVLTSSYYFQGSGATTTGEYTVKGPYTSDFATGELIPAGKNQWSPCTTQRALSLNTALRISAASASQKIQGDAYLDELRLKIATRACP